ncbi:hypothetical protein [Maribellus comscasis]|uniref:hypothetical protein n=1 Tax=Maribellus comscasis TaxID=2681766 RepID=UPI00131D239F|nr:hypothetical protein [Maribellus comscasis]
MKNFFTTLFFILLCINSLYPQVPGAFSYQAVVRNLTGDVLSNQDVTFRISILQDSESGTVVYVETHSVTTNDFGLANLKIGTGTVVDGTFGNEGWGTALHFLKVEIDPDGGTSFIEMGTTQLLAVPYAFHAQTVENDQIDDADADAANELQTLSVSGNNLSISDGNTVALPAGSTSPWTNSTAGIKYFGGKVGINHDPADDSGALQVWGEDGMSLEIVNNSVTFPNIYAQNNSGTAAYIDGKLVIDDGTQGAGKVLTSDSGGKASWATPGTGLWTQNGSEIYFNGNVGIGTTDPIVKLDVSDDSGETYSRIQSTASDAGLFIERSGGANMAGLIFKTGGANGFYTGLLGSYSYKISTQNPTLNGLEVEIDGDVVLSDELHSTATGNSNMMPFAYGYISSAASKTGCTSNVGTVSKMSTGQYKVEIADLGSDYTVVVTINHGLAYSNAVVMGRNSAYFTVATWDTKSDGYVDAGFSFIVYKP